jgi:hypothetical protein
MADNNISTTTTTIGVSDGTTGQWDNGNWYQPTYTIPLPTYIPVSVPVVIPSIWILPSPPTVVTIKEEKMEDKMFIYEVTVVDKKECKILTNQTVVAKDRQSAMLELDLTPEIKLKNKKGEIEFIFIEKGAFNKIEKKETK